MLTDAQNVFTLHEAQHSEVVKNLSLFYHKWFLLSNATLGSKL